MKMEIEGEITPAYEVSGDVQDECYVSGDIAIGDKDIDADVISNFDIDNLMAM